MPAVLGISVDFLLFAATLLGVALLHPLLHHHMLRVALIGWHPTPERAAAEPAPVVVSVPASLSLA